MCIRLSSPVPESHLSLLARILAQSNRIMHSSPSSTVLILLVLRQRSRRRRPTADPMHPAQSRGPLQIARRQPAALEQGSLSIVAIFCPDPLQIARSEEHTSELQSQSNI